MIPSSFIKKLVLTVHINMLSVILRCNLIELVFMFCGSDDSFVRLDLINIKLTCPTSIMKTTVYSAKKRFYPFNIGMD